MEQSEVQVLDHIRTKRVNSFGSVRSDEFPRISDSQRRSKQFNRRADDLISLNSPLVKEFENHLRNSQGGKFSVYEARVSHFVKAYKLQHGKLCEVRLEMQKGKWAKRFVLLLEEGLYLHCFVEPKSHQVNSGKRITVPVMAAFDPFYFVKDSIPKVIFPEAERLLCTELGALSLRKDNFWGEVMSDSTASECRGSYCQCRTNRLTPVMNSALNFICAKRNTDFPINLISTITEDSVCSPNNTKSYQFQNQSGRSSDNTSYKQLVPQPYLVNHSTLENKVFKSALSDSNIKDSPIAFLYSQIEPKNVKQAYKFYSGRSEENHPFLMSPEYGSELELLTRNLHGLESLAQVCLQVHPAALPVFTFMSTLDKDFTVTQMEVRDPRDVEEHLAQVHLETLRGKGSSIRCAQCSPLFNSNRQISELPSYTRDEYIQHYQEYHQSSLAAITSFTETNSSQKVYEAFVLYILCRGFATQEKLNPVNSPVERVTLEQKFRKIVGISSQRTPERSTTMANIRATSEVQDELLNNTPPPGEEPEVHAHVYVSNPYSALSQDDDSEKDKYI
jgi:hypothetical protein